MPDSTVDFDAVDLAGTIEQLTQHELDHLPFGVILLDKNGTVRFYSEAEARLSGFGRIPTGENFWSLAPCLQGDDFRGRVERAIEQQGKVDLEIGWYGDFSDPDRDMRIRVQSARSGGVWIMIQRDTDDGKAATPRDAKSSAPRGILKD